MTTFSACEDDVAEPLPPDAPPPVLLLDELLLLVAVCV
jgi:hypothetical protein